MNGIKKHENFPLWPKFFNDLFDRNWMDFSTRNFSNTNTTLPSVNIKEDDGGFEVEMAAPGFEKKDFKIDLENSLLTISSEKKVDSETKKGQQFTQREFSYQSFSRSFTLPQTAESDKISAKYENGVLKIAIPKKEEAKPKPAKKIEIN
ncbi:Hsp20/alpha crystallin family protein [Sunxiuqinia indica]|uniref:Hsp20/alpha crystallin family protein n=1 Tax=Sunxiuqinia indica TaxID=2692584 RepID=UPI00135C1A6E|nr:Hsp20/alpha crystallin family protein [Sunxiuqinia indica]